MATDSSTPEVTSSSHLLWATPSTEANIVDLGQYDWPQGPSDAGIDTGNPCSAESATVASIGAKEADVLANLGISPGTRRLATFHEAEALWSDDCQPIQVWTAGSNVIVVEASAFAFPSPRS